METSERTAAFTTGERHAIDLSTQIQGWGADLDPETRPGVPRDKAPYAGIESLYPVIERQVTDVEILVSTEHQRMPPVFGTTCPPRGLSGAMRRFAFGFSENELTHWFTLLLADRVDVAENLLVDLSRGEIPNLFKEMGLATEWKYNRKSVIKKLFVAGASVAAVTALVVWKKRRDARELN